MILTLNLYSHTQKSNIHEKKNWESERDIIEKAIKQKFIIFSPYIHISTCIIYFLISSGFSVVINSTPRWYESEMPKKLKKTFPFSASKVCDFFHTRFENLIGNPPHKLTPTTTTTRGYTVEVATYKHKKISFSLSHNTQYFFDMKRSRSRNIIILCVELFSRHRAVWESKQ